MPGWLEGQVYDVRASIAGGVELTQSAERRARPHDRSLALLGT